MTKLKEILNEMPSVAAEKLIGFELYHYNPITGEKVGGVIVETEAYLASDDSAAHNSRGKTKANSSLFKEAGTMYIHSMRQYLLLDLVTQGEDFPGSVLIRAIEPKEGIEKMYTNRGIQDIKSLCNGPGKLCISLGIMKNLDGENIFSDLCPVKVIEPRNGEVYETTVSKRIGINKNSDALLRFTLKNSKFTSK